MNMERQRGKKRIEGGKRSYSRLPCGGHGGQQSSKRQISADPIEESRKFPTPMDQAPESDELGLGGMEVEVEPLPLLPSRPRSSPLGFPNVFETKVVRDLEMSLKIISLIFPRLGGFGFPVGFLGGLGGWQDISTTTT
ncbi:hypothetical protein MRB53_018908 [Persea americana]|uniref:Uncharacterized protein n=1 Tax=Persea americana TaxID=3435 RepID=A0ACC2M9B6_PERAE|nr:hypothetical protein MRB53_018908 [Persea americana]